MYIGIGPEKGQRIPDREAFGYACERCRYGGLEEQETFFKLVKECGSLLEFVDHLVEWFFSGNWLYDERDNKKTNWTIRFSDGNLRSYFGTYADAVENARQEAQGKQLGFVVN